jgi:hypothetical protein
MTSPWRGPEACARTSASRFTAGLEVHRSPVSKAGANQSGERARAGIKPVATRDRNPLCLRDALYFGVCRSQGNHAIIGSPYWHLLIRQACDGHWAPWQEGAFWWMLKRISHRMATRATGEIVRALKKGSFEGSIVGWFSKKSPWIGSDEAPEFVDEGVLALQRALREELRGLLSSDSFGKPYSC